MKKTNKNAARQAAEPNHTLSAGQAPFTKYQVFIVAILAILQFTIILDFMVLSPLGAQLIQELEISTQQFGWVVSAYAFSAGASGLLAAGFADKFDRKKLLLFFYAGFILGTLFCGLAPDYHFLLAARVITGLFGGVIGSISFAIITDLFPLQMRGRVMGFVQMAFATSQVLGIPISLYLANTWGWHSPFLLIVGVSVIVGLAIARYMKPIKAHLQLQSDRNAFRHLAGIVSNPHYLKGFAAITLLATGGFMLMPFASAFTVYNLGIDLETLPMLYMATGISAMVFGPLIGKLSDRLGKYKVFFWGSILTMVVVVIHCNMGISPLWLVLLVNVIMFVGITARMISASALMTAIPESSDRGAYMSIQSSVQQISGGLASAFAGLIVVQTSEGTLEHYDLLGYLVVLSSIVTIVMMLLIDRSVKQKADDKALATEKVVA
ncbi:putative MFS family arabinose efflux permease [Pontibacter ummariensis]|uniref:Predicted arabinose efflux permease, MFS family n=1 Tax=Pontibacter ummariensis TaxID=1610492 RepID=A0A239GP20_9BACT|nr:MFS transporter [Pontibacter ummariensis]PRY11356.1 putative MFS family arabinose efflux permease [Pontibacter ummariensis]SNS70615.1 Predicted arabinose efflux permease, MFS family [Pontibacter ummariensis]